jgi:hypothetical protein
MTKDKVWEIDDGGEIQEEEDKKEGVGLWKGGFFLEEEEGRRNLSEKEKFSLGNLVGL